MARRRVNTTKHEIVRCATTMFIEKGYTNTSPKAICDELDISTGNLTYYFPTKEHLLAELVEILCSFQWKLMQDEADDSAHLLMALALELMSMAAAAEENDIVKDFFISAYCSPLCLNIIRRNDTQRAETVFKNFVPHWTHDRFVEAEIIVSGVEYATLMTAGEPIPLETRIAGAIDTVFRIYGVSKDIRETKIAKALSMDYRSIGRQIFTKFKLFVDETNEHTLEELLRKRSKNDDR